MCVRVFGSALLESRQLDYENCPSFVPVAARNFAAMFLDNAVTGAQPQACSLTDGPRCIERIENAFGLGHSGPVVCELNAHNLRRYLCRDGQRASTLRHCMSGVVDDVRKDLE